MKTFANCFLLLAICGGGVGCFPARFTVSPGARGTVVDARTHAPIQGAEVFVSRQRYKIYAITNETIEGVSLEAKAAPPPEPPPLNLAISNARPPIVVTGSDGRFTIPPTKEWGLYIVPMDVFPSHGTLVVRRDGYVSEMRLVDSRTNVAVVGNVPLTIAKE